jgi:hypothetical protein
MNDWDKMVEQDKLDYEDAQVTAFEIAKKSDFEEFKKYIIKIYDIGFKEGQTYSGMIRSAHFHNGKLVLPGDDDYYKEVDRPSYIITSTDESNKEQL